MIDPNIASAHDDKSLLRKQLLAVRKAMPPAARQQAQACIGKHLRATVQHLAADSGRGQSRWPEAAPGMVGVYWPIAGEPDLHATWASLREDGFELALPVAPARHQALDYRAWNEQVPLRKDASGVPAPLEAPSGDIAVALLPCVGLHPEGWRLGYGGGYFDRTLQAWESSGRRASIVVIGVAFELQRCRWEPDRHDRRLDAVITEAGVQCWAGPHQGRRD
jgi:5,10-methenyltetrahydrofolate synthetase